MPIEIEKKYLVHKNKLPVLADGQYFTQGYLSRKPNVRFRVIGDDVTITIKKGIEGISRYEWEFKQNLPKAEIEELVKLAICKHIEKIRYKIPFEALVWEIDVYQGDNDGLITADVELPSVDYPIIFPDWIDKESDISSQPQYFNYNLGENPFKEWEKVG